MLEYHKIQTVWLRDPTTSHKYLLGNTWAKPEFEYLQNNEWQFTEKVDGTNVRLMHYGNGSMVQVGGKTDSAQLPTTLMDRLFNGTPNARELAKKLNEIFGINSQTQVCLYGEGYGAKIQKGGGNYGPNQDFILFDIWVNGWWLRRPDVEDVANKLGLKVVPVIGTGTLWHMINLVQSGFKSAWGDFQAEGIVARPLVELVSRNSERIITKLKYRDFPHN